MTSIVDFPDDLNDIESSFRAENGRDKIADDVPEEIVEEYDASVPPETTRTTGRISFSKSSPQRSSTSSIYLDPIHPRKIHGSSRSSQQVNKFTFLELDLPSTHGSADLVDVDAAFNHLGEGLRSDKTREEASIQDDDAIWKSFFEGNLDLGVKDAWSRFSSSDSSRKESLTLPELLPRGKVNQTNSDAIGNSDFVAERPPAAPAAEDEVTKQQGESQGREGKDSSKVAQASPARPKTARQRPKTARTADVKEDKSNAGIRDNRAKSAPSFRTSITSFLRPDEFTGVPVILRPKTPEETLDRIERENHILLQRMARQMAAPNGFSGIAPDYRLKKINVKPAASERKKREEQQQIEKENLDVLDREGVEPPVKGKLPIRLNRSEVLRRTWYQRALEEQRKLEPVIDERDPRGVLRRSPSPHRPGEIKPRRPVSVHVTKAEQLRKKFIDLMMQGEEGRKKWFQEHGSGTSDPLDVFNRRTQSAGSSRRSSPSRDRSRTRNRSSSPGRLPVRENRAQRLRIEEQKRSTPADRDREHVVLWHPAHLGNVEARIDFGQNGWYKAVGRPSEVDKETLVSNNTPDESEFEPEANFDEGAVADFSQDERTWDTVLMGIALRDGCKLPIAYPTAVRVYWSSESETKAYEHDHILGTVMRTVKETADLIGVEFSIRDLHWGASRQLLDSQKQFSICLNQLEACINMLETADMQGADLMRTWYRLDENSVPPKYILRSISSVLPDFAFSADPRVIAETDKIWE
ncbi:hypothetical protein HDU96_001755 [Phlyctochytrium bullatum]|nr:hypothetical protein HDU96_001755 [Phlyctochytrium bullatum]